MSPRLPISSFLHVRCHQAAKTAKDALFDARKAADVAERSARSAEDDLAVAQTQQKRKVCEQVRQCRACCDGQYAYGLVWAR